MADKGEDAIVVLMTTGSREEAARLAEIVVAAKLAACVQIMPEMESVYWWEGQVERAPEHLLLVKTTTARFEELESAVRALHSYETPEIVALPITKASAPYLKWLTSIVQPQSQQPENNQRAASARENGAQRSQG
jgi:periplasmic divalent cation tolerance protein